MRILYVYTAYTLFFMALLMACVIMTALLGTYLAVKVKKDALFFSYLLVQALLLMLIGAKLLELVSPVRPTADLYLAFQTASVRMIGPALFIFPATLFFYRKGRGLKLLSLAFALASAACLAFIPAETKWARDGASAAALFVWTAFVFFWRREIFAELSELAVDTFMDKIEDAVLIFSPAQKLIDLNRKARTMFPFLNASSTADELFRYVGGRCASEDPALSLKLGGSGPVTFGMREGSGVGYFQFRTAEVKQNGEKRATVVTLHDVTERTVLLLELEEKNAELQRLNEDLRRSIDVTGLLASEEEKERSWAIVQEKIGQSIEKLLGELEALEACEQTRDESVGRRLDRMIESCRSVMSAIRKSVEEVS